MKLSLLPGWPAPCQQSRPRRCPAPCMWLNEQRGKPRARQCRQSHQKKKGQPPVRPHDDCLVPSGSHQHLQTLSCHNLRRAHEGGPGRHSPLLSFQCPALCSGAGSCTDRDPGLPARRGRRGSCSELNPTWLTSWDYQDPTLVLLQTGLRSTLRALGVAGEHPGCGPGAGLRQPLSGTLAAAFQGMGSGSPWGMAAWFCLRQELQHLPVSMFPVSPPNPLPSTIWVGPPPFAFPQGPQRYSRSWPGGGH